MQLEEGEAAAELLALAADARPDAQTTGDEHRPRTVAVLTSLLLAAAGLSAAAALGTRRGARSGKFTGRRGDATAVSLFGERDDDDSDASVRFASEKLVAATDSDAKSADVADIDGDGWPDVVYVSQASNRVVWFRNLGGGSFDPEPKTVADEVSGASCVLAVDLNGDWMPDLLVAAMDKSAIFVYTNIGDGNFGEKSVVSSDAFGVTGVFAADMNGDGKPDVLSASRFDNKVAWYANQGGSWGDQTVITEEAWGAISVFAADIDGDKSMDALSASVKDSCVAWYRFDGKKWVKETVGQPEGVYSVYSADMDGDGHVDVLSTSPSEGKVLLYKSKGGGDGGDFQGFEDAQVLTASAPGAVYVRASDLDGDGDLDVLVASMYSNRVSWFENFGGGQFSDEHIVSSKASGVSFVVAADVNADGEQDIVSASVSDGKLAWYENMGGKASCNWASPGPGSVCKASSKDKSEWGDGAGKPSKMEFNECKSKCADDDSCPGIEYDFEHRHCTLWTKKIGYFASTNSTNTHCYRCSRPDR